MPANPFCLVNGAQLSSLFLRPAQRNRRVAVSASNDGALRFYQRLGFDPQSVTLQPAGMAPPLPYGHCIEHPEILIAGMSVEHGHLDTSASFHPLRVGDRLTFIPLHQEMCLNLHDELVAICHGHVEIIWPVLGRGKVEQSTAATSLPEAHRTRGIVAKRG